MQLNERHVSHRYDYWNDDLLTLTVCISSVNIRNPVGSGSVPIKQAKKTCSVEVVASAGEHRLHTLSLGIYRELEHCSTVADVALWQFYV